MAIDGNSQARVFLKTYKPVESDRYGSRARTLKVKKEVRVQTPCAFVQTWVMLILTYFGVTKLQIAFNRFLAHKGITDHPNVVRLLRVGEGTLNVPSTGRSASIHFIVNELCSGGEVFNYIDAYVGRVGFSLFEK